MVSCWFRAFTNWPLLAQSASPMLSAYPLSEASSTSLRIENSASNVDELPSLHGNSKGSSSVYCSRFTRFSFASVMALIAADISSTEAEVLSRTALPSATAAEYSSQPLKYHSDLASFPSCTSSSRASLVELSVSRIVIAALSLKPTIRSSVMEVSSRVNCRSPV